MTYPDTVSSMEQLDVIDMLVKRAPSVLDERYGQPRCIAAVRHGLEVLRYFGVTARPQKTQAIVGNRPWLDWFIADEREEEMPADAWSVGIDLVSKRHGGYPGHLVIVATVNGVDLLVDLDAGQFSRPERGIAVERALVLELEEDWRQRGAGWWSSPDDGAVIMHRFLPERDWMYAPDWRRRPPLAGELIREIRAKEVTR